MSHPTTKAEARLRLAKTGVIVGALWIVSPWIAVLLGLIQATTAPAVCYIGLILAAYSAWNLHNRAN